MNGFSHFPAGIGSALLIALLVSAITAFTSHKNPMPPGLGWGSGVGLGVAYVVGHAFIREWMNISRFNDLQVAFRNWNGELSLFPLLPSDAVDWLPWLASGGCLLGLLDSRWPAPWWARWENRLVLTFLTVWLTLSPLLGGSWEPIQGALWMTCLGSAFLVYWTIMVTRAERLTRAMPMILSLLSSALAICLGLSGSFVYGGLGGVLAAACGGLWLTSWWDGEKNLSRSVIPMYVTTFCGLIFCGLFYAELPPASAILLTLAPMMTYVDRCPLIARFRPARVDCCRTAALLIPLTSAVAWAVAMRPVYD